MAKDKYIPCLLQLFRQYGYEGTTLSKIAQATGLGKASLYHHFPGGKEEMVSAVLDFLEWWSQEHIIGSLRSEGDALTRLQRMSASISEIYEKGRQPCLFAILLMGSAKDIFQDRVRAILNMWIEEMAQVLVEAGLYRTEARERAEDAAIAIQGALILARGLDDLSIFHRTLERLPQQMCQ